MNDTAHMGALLGDLVTAVYALATEGEKGNYLKQRLAEVKARADAIVRLAERIAKTRDETGI